MTEREKRLELLNRLFDAARGDIAEEWSDDAYVLADLILKVETSPEVVARDYATSTIIDILADVYKIDRRISINYVMNTNEFMDNVMDRIDEAMVQELEEFVSSTDILKHQK